MFQPLYPPAGPQSIAEVLDAGFRIFQRSVLRCLPYGALSMILGQVQNIYSIVVGRPAARFGGGDPVWWLLFIAGVVMTMWLWMALILRQYRTAIGAPSSIAQDLREAVRLIPSYLLLAVIGALMGAVAAGFVVAVYLLSGKTNIPATLIAIAIVTVPLGYFFTPLALGTPALVIDRKGAGAFAYAVRLVRRNWWRMSAILSVTVVVLIVFYLVATVLVMLALPLFARVDLASITAATTVVYVVLGGVSLPFVNATMLAAYGELKVRREGLDLEQRVATVAQA